MSASTETVKDRAPTATRVEINMQGKPPGSDAALGDIVVATLQGFSDLDGDTESGRLHA